MTDGGCGGAAVWGSPLALGLPVVFILWTFLIVTGEHRFVCHGIISPTVQRALCRLPLVQIKPSVLVLSQAPLHSCLQSKWTHTHDESHASRKQKSMEEATANSALLSSQLKISLPPPLSSKVLILRDSGLSFCSGSCLMNWNTS